MDWNCNGFYSDLDEDRILIEDSVGILSSQLSEGAVAVTPPL